MHFTTGHLQINQALSDNCKIYSYPIVNYKINYIQAEDSRRRVLMCTNTEHTVDEAEIGIKYASQVKITGQVICYSHLNVTCTTAPTMSIKRDCKKIA